MKCLSKIFVLGLLLASCSPDDGTTTTPIDSSPKDDPSVTPTLSELRDETMQILTNNGSPKVWKISSAVLKSGASSLDISTNFNVVDDEVIFSGDTSNGFIQWRKGHDIGITGLTTEETLLDYYRSPNSSSFSFTGDSSSNLTSTIFDFQIAEDNTITITLGNGSGTAKADNGSEKNSNGELTITLGEKEQSDFTVPPSNLAFTEAFVLESSSVQNHSAGMIGSYSDNSFYFLTREDALSFDNQENISNIYPERVVRFDLDNNSQLEYVNYDADDEDFVSKQLHIVNNQLISIGAQKISTYDFNLSEPTTVPFTEGLVSDEFGNPIAFTRFGMAVLDDAVYIVGGAFNTQGVDESEFVIEETKNIYKWDLETQTLTHFSTLPEPRFGARATIVNDKMYIFGGSSGFYDNSPTSTIYVIDMDSPSDVQTLNMSTAIGYSFVQKYQNLIYITGHTRTQDEEPPTYQETIFAVFNTENNSYEELPHNLTNPNGGYAVHQMTIFNGKMFVLFGDSDETLANENNHFKPVEEWIIYEADLE
ncbi:hypothetical protein [Flagellimonas iocasae]|uniref:Kelch motif-containing protein n=1 Tax=Flagellimonas iocasae TaxID=2055905 RepID=A0ABW4XW09_9FLAO